VSRGLDRTILLDLELCGAGFGSAREAIDYCVGGGSGASLGVENSTDYFR